MRTYSSESNPFEFKLDNGWKATIKLNTSVIKAVLGDRMVSCLDITNRSESRMEQIAEKVAKVFASTMVQLKQVMNSRTSVDLKREKLQGEENPFDLKKYSTNLTTIASISGKLELTSATVELFKAFFTQHEANFGNLNSDDDAIKPKESDHKSTETEASGSEVEEDEKKSDHDIDSTNELTENGSLSFSENENDLPAPLKKDEEITPAPLNEEETRVPSEPEPSSPPPLTKIPEPLLPKPPVPINLGEVLNIEFTPISTAPSNEDESKNSSASPKDGKFISRNPELYEKRVVAWRTRRNKNALRTTSRPSSNKKRSLGNSPRNNPSPRRRDSKQLHQPSRALNRRKNNKIFSNIH